MTFQAYGTENNQSIFIQGTVIEILDDHTDTNNYFRYQKVLVTLTDKEYSSMEILINHSINLATLHHLILEEGDKVIVWANGNESNFDNARIYSYSRDSYLLYLVIGFISLVIIIGGKKGFSAIISLGITLGLVFIGFFPMIINGVNPILSALLVCGISAILTLIIIGDFKGKTYAAIIGTLGGISVAIILTYVFGYLTKIQGIGDENVEMLAYIPNSANYNFRDLLYAGIIIGTLGGVMDICMSISSAMDEIHQANKRSTNLNLFLSGMRIGKDILGTMTNTLILAYVGSSINLILVFYTYGLTITQFINSDQIASEIIRAFAGSIGLVFAIPITAVAYLAFRDKNKNHMRI